MAVQTKKLSDREANAFLDPLENIRHLWCEFCTMVAAAGLAQCITYRSIRLQT